MTALSEFQRLESSGLWRETPQSQRRDVIVSFGEASLVIASQREVALSHWSLAAVTRLNPGETPALFGPAADAEETLEIDDQTMIDAITRVIDAIDSAKPRHGRLRFLISSLAIAFVVALMVFWLPGALRRHTASVIPDTVRQEIGNQLLSSVARVAGAPCSGQNGNVSLRKLALRLFPDDPGRIVVLPSGVIDAAHMPGRIVILNRAVVEDFEDASVAAGFVLAERSRASADDPLERLLRDSGPLTVFRLLTTGTLTPETLSRYAESLLTTPPVRIANERLLAEFQAHGVPSTPYAFALDSSGETVLGLIEADPMRGKEVEPVLSDADWVRLQGICEP